MSLMSAKELLNMCGVHFLWAKWCKNTTTRRYQ